MRVTFDSRQGKAKGIEEKECPAFQKQSLSGSGLPAKYKS